MRGNPSVELALAALAMLRSDPRRVRVASMVALGSCVVFMAVVEFGRGDGSATPWVWAGLDYRTYTEAASRWLAGGSFYPARELAGPFQLTTNQEVLYPPTTIPLFAVFTVLPAILWWIIPTGVLAWSVWRHRPNPPALVLILIAAITPWTWVEWVMGNPVIWAVAAVGLATHFGAAGPAVLLKPTLAPLALVGVRTRGWWVALGAGVVLAVAFAPLWPDYLAVIRDASGGRVGVLYGIGDLSIACIPLLAWAGASATS